MPVLCGAASLELFLCNDASEPIGHKRCVSGAIPWKASMNNGAAEPIGHDLMSSCLLIAREPFITNDASEPIGWRRRVTVVRESFRGSARESEISNRVMRDHQQIVISIKRVSVGS